MAYDEKLAVRIRERVSELPKVEEKEMMGGLVFMYHGKICLGIIKDELMCRIDPALHDMEVEKHGCSTCEISIFQATYKRKSVFYTSMTAPACSWVFSVDLFNCSGEFIKHFSSSDQDEFYDKVSERLKIYSCE